MAQFEPEWLADRVMQRTLAIHDEGDRVAPLAAGQRVVHALRYAALHTTRGLGHNRVLADPAVAAAVLQHLL
jgi:pimeloyl-ACP methyl ester carboxylesterase